MKQLTEVEAKVLRWIRAQVALERAKREVISLECEERNAENDLGRSLTPEDAGAQEPFHFWFHSGLLEVRHPTQNDWSVRWRTPLQPGERTALGL